MGGRRDEIRSRHTKYRHSDINAALVEVRQLLSASASSSGGFTEWHDAYFEEIKLNPSGKVWLRLADVEIPDDEMQLIC